MSLIFVGVIPNKKNLTAGETALNEKEHKFNEALQELVGELYCMKPDTVLIVSQYGLSCRGALNLNISDKLYLPSDDEDFIRPVKNFYKNDLLFLSQLKETAENESLIFSLVCTAIAVLPKKISSAIRQLFKPLVNTKIALVGLPDISLKKIWAAGNFFCQEIIKSNRRIAVIAVGNFKEDSHQQKTLSRLCLSLLQQREVQVFKKISKELVQSAQSDLLYPLVFIAGLLSVNNFIPIIKCSCQFKDKRALVINFELK